MKVKRSDLIGIILFCAPALLLFLVFFVFPVGYISVMSLFEWDGITQPHWVGLDNFREIFQDRAFRISLRNNFLWAGAAVFIQVPLALIMALILSKKVRGWKIFRTVFFMPQVISGIAMATLWASIYNSEFGLLNALLKAMGLISQDASINWLGNPDTALFCVIIYGVLYFGYFMVILMAGISGIDQTFYEAATVDGASPFQMNIHITIPLIRSSISTCVTLGAVFALRTFEQVFRLTGGGPANRTSVMVLYMYRRMADRSYGMANASSVVLVLVGVIVIIGIRSLFSIERTSKVR